MRHRGQVDRPLQPGNPPHIIRMEGNNGLRDKRVVFVDLTEVKAAGSTQSPGTATPYQQHPQLPLLQEHPPDKSGKGPESNTTHLDVESDIVS